MDIKTILQDERKKKIIIIGLGVLILLLGTVFLFTKKQPTPQNNQDEQTKILNDLAQLAPRDGTTSNGRTVLPIITITTTAPIVAPGQSSIVSWESDNATSCVDGNGNSILTNGSLSITPTENYTLDIICTNQKGTSFESATVAVTTTPIITLSADPEAVYPGGQSVISWNTVNTTRCVDVDGKTIRLSGSLTVAPKAPYIFKIDCVGPNGTGEKSLIVKMTPTPIVVRVVQGSPTTPAPETTETTPTTKPTTTVTPKPTTTVTPSAGSGPTITLTSSAGKVEPGEKATVSWSATNATSCKGRFTSGAILEIAGHSEVMSAGETGPLPTSGDFKVGVLAGRTSATVYITCTGPSGTTTKSMTVYANTSLGITAPPIITITAEPKVFINSGGTSNITWDAINATTCTGTASDDSWAEWFNPVSNKLVNTHDFPFSVKASDKAKLHVGQADPDPNFQPKEVCTESISIGDSQGKECSVPPPPSSATFTVKCTGPRGTREGSVTVSVVSQCEARKLFPEINIDIAIGNATFESIFGDGCNKKGWLGGF